MGAIRKAQIIGRREGGRPADIQRRRRPEQDPGRVHQEQIGAAEAGRLDGSEDVRRVSARDTTEDIGGGQGSFVQEVGDIVGGDAEFAEAMKEIGPAPRSGSAGDVVLNRPPGSGMGALTCVLRPEEVMGEVCE